MCRSGTVRASSRGEGLPVRCCMRLGPSLTPDPTYLGLGLHLGSVLQQVPDHVCLARPRRHVQRRLPPLANTHTHTMRRVPVERAFIFYRTVGFATYHVGGVGRCPVMRERVNNVLVAHEGCYMDGGQARLQTERHSSHQKQGIQIGCNGAKPKEPAYDSCV